MTSPRERDPLTYAIIGAAMEVHRELGPGFLEAVYHEALKRELVTRDIPFETEVQLQIQYKGELLLARYRVDLICFGCLIVELKAQRVVGPTEEAQVLNYLKASHLSQGLLINFGASSLGYRRFVWTHQGNQSAQSV